MCVMCLICLMCVMCLMCLMCVMSPLALMLTLALALSGAPAPLGGAGVARAEEFVPWSVLKKRRKEIKETRERYNKSAGQERGELLAALVRLDPQGTRPLVEEALTQREDPTRRAAGLRAAALYDDGALRALALNALTSPYVMERLELVRTLSAWGGEQGLLGLKELALDKSVSVRRGALEALGALGGADDLLRSYAVEGPDEGTAESAARAWLRAAGARAPDVALALLSASYEEARAVGSAALVAAGAGACASLSGALLRGEGHEGAVEGALRALWAECEGPLFDLAARGRGEGGVDEGGGDEGRARLLGALRRWGERGARARALTETLLSAEGPEALRAAAAAAAAPLAPPERLRLLRPLLSSPSEQERCAALRALCAPVGEERAPVGGEAREECLARARAEIRAHLPEPAPRREALACALEVLPWLRGGELDDLLAEAYSSWRVSIAYGQLRLALTHAAAASPAPTRLNTLMEAMLDPDPRVKEEAERALRR